MEKKLKLKRNRSAVYLFTASEKKKYKRKKGKKTLKNKTKNRAFNKCIQEKIEDKHYSAKEDAKSQQ